MANSGDRFDVIVVGAGIMGSATAYELAKRGKKTLLLEHSTSSTIRTIRSTYPEDYYAAMAVEASKLWEKAESEVGFKVYFKAPQFDMGPKDSKSLAAVVSSCRKNSILVKVAVHGGYSCDPDKRPWRLESSFRKDQLISIVFSFEDDL